MDMEWSTTLWSMVLPFLVALWHRFQKKNKAAHHLQEWIWCYYFFCCLTKSGRRMKMMMRASIISCTESVCLYLLFYGFKESLAFYFIFIMDSSLLLGSGTSLGPLFTPYLVLFLCWVPSSLSRQFDVSISSCQLLSLMAPLDDFF